MYYIKGTFARVSSNIRRRPKSAPYLRLKNSKRNSNCQSIFCHRPPKTQIGALKGGTLSHFLTSIVAKHQNIEGEPFGNFFSGKSLTMPKKLKPFSLSRYCMLRGKRGIPFWFSSLGQMIQFGTIKFRRTSKNYFGQFVWIEKN